MNGSIIRDDMIITATQVLDARAGKEFAKWPNQNDIPSVKGYIPFEFGANLNNDQTKIVEIVIDRFNKDMSGCIMIR